MNTKISLENLQAVESIIFDFRRLYASENLQFLLSLNGNLVTANALPYKDGIPCISQFNSIFDEIIDNHIGEITEWSQSFALLTAGYEGRFKDYQKGLPLLRNDPYVLLSRATSDEVLSLVDFKKLECLPKLLYHVTFLDSNKTFDFVLVDSSDEIRVLSLKLSALKN